MDNYKLRIKHSSGAEFEAEGPENFILSEKREFLANLNQETEQNQANTPSSMETEIPVFWQTMIDKRDNLHILKAKSPQINPTEAAIIIISANQIMSHNDKMSAISLSKSLKISGYEPERLDRLLTTKIKQGEIIASGSKRNRLYKLNQQGIQSAYLAIKKLKKTLES